MRVLQVISGIGASCGGPTTALVGLCESQVRAGIDVTLAATWQEDESHITAKRLRQAGVKVVMIGRAHGKLSRHRDLVPMLSDAMRGADIVHIHALFEEIEHQAAVMAHRMGIPYIFTPHGMLDTWSMAQSRFGKWLYMLWRLRRDLDRAAAIHCITAMERGMVAKLGLKAPLFVEPIGLDLREFDNRPPAGNFRRNYPQIGQRPMVLFLGRIDYKKGMDLMLRAFARASADPAASDAILVIAGPDSSGYRSKLDPIIAQEKLANRVIFTGMLYGPQRIEALVDADLFLLSSYEENFGVAVIESLAAATAVVITDRVGAHEELSAAGVATVVSADVQPVADAIIHQLKNPTDRQDQARRGAQFVREHYNSEAIAEHWVKRYRDLLRHAK